MKFCVTKDLRVIFTIYKWFKQYLSRERLKKIFHVKLIDERIKTKQQKY